MIERRVFELKQVSIADSGEFTGYASVFGNIDDGGDVVLPGAFEKALPAFLENGFISWQHNWEQPVAIPIEAKEDATGLLIRAEFHSTTEAQQARTITNERLAAGKSMGLSIGYGVEEEEYNSTARLLRVINPLYETALVTVPMNRLANVTSVKGALAPERPFAERLGLVLDEAKAVAEHARSRVALRSKEGRVLSASNRDLLASLMEQLNQVSQSVRDLLDATDPTKDANAAQAVLAEFEYLTGRLAAV